jgi:hypothetical protein
VLVETSVQAGQAELGQIIERRIVERTWRRIRQLRVQVCAGRVVVHGQTLWYYAKQLAIQAVLEALREAGVTAVVDARISVSAPLSRDHQLARPRPFPEAAGEGRTLTERPVVLGKVSPEVSLSELFGRFGPDGTGKTTLVNAPREESHAFPE